MALYNEQVRTGFSKLHPWQVETHRRFALPDGIFNYGEDVNRMNLVAANGSGKSSKVVAPCAAWLSMAHSNSVVAITSASGKQLDHQTGGALRHLCLQVNRLHNKPYWILKYRELTYDPTGNGDPDGKNVSKIYLYATDEPGKAEGYHPSVDGGRFAYIADEAKTVTDEIFGSIERCNGKSHWLNVSSPGQPIGFFYNAFCSDYWWNRRVTAYECPHIKKSEIESARRMWGEASEYFRSAYLAEFTSVNESVVITFEKLLRQYRNPPRYLRDGVKRAGVDLSAGGDEQVVVVMDGNQQIGLEVFRLSDHRAIVKKLVDIFRKYGLAGENINVDDGYTGRAVIDFLRNEGYEVMPCQFGGKAFNNVAYGNRGTELWLNFERHLESLILLDDEVMKKQLASRYYKKSDTTGKILLESKREARAQGHGSPDRADAAVLALARIPLGYFSGNFATAELSDSEQAAELLKKLAVDHTSVKLTDDQITQITLVYQQLKAQRKAVRSPRGSDSSDCTDMASDKSHYDCVDMVASGVSEENTFKFGRN